MSRVQHLFYELSQGWYEIDNIWIISSFGKLIRIHIIEWIELFNNCSMMEIQARDKEKSCGSSYFLSFLMNFWHIFLKFWMGKENILFFIFFLKCKYVIKIWFTKSSITYHNFYNPVKSLKSVSQKSKRHIGATYRKSNVERNLSVILSVILSVTRS